MMQNIVKYIVSFLCLGGILAGLIPLWGDTVIWKPSGNEAGFYLDIPPEWEKDYEIKKNGVVFSAVDGKLSMTVKSFVVEKPVNAREILNGRAAYLSGRYSYIYLMREKILGDEGWGVIAYWKLHHRKKSYLEKTIIYVKNGTVLMLICSGPEKEFEKAKIIFDNAILSFGFYDPELELDPGVNRYEISPSATTQEMPADTESSPEPTVDESQAENSGEGEPIVEESVEETVDTKTGDSEEAVPEKEVIKEETKEEESRGWRPAKEENQ